MKIIHIISSLSNGGAEKFVVELANEQSKENELVIVSFRPIENWMIFPKMILPHVKLIQLNKKEGLDIRLYFNLYHIFKSEKPTVVHFHLDSTVKYIMPYTFIFNKVKYVYSIHSKLNHFNIKKFRLLNTLANIKKNIKYVCISPSIKSEFTQQFKKLNFYFIPNGVNKIKATIMQDEVKKEVRKYKKNLQTKLAIAVGRVDDVKNHILLVKAFKKLKKLNVTCIILGKALDENSEIMQEIRKNNYGNVHFLGFKANVGDFFNEADFFVISSLFEGMPISALEALSVGLPIITTPAGGMVDIVEDGINGFISNNFNLENFLKQVSSFLDLDTKELQEMKDRNIKKHEENYSMELCSKKYLELYTEY